MIQNLENRIDPVAKRSFKERMQRHYRALKPILLSHHPLCDEFQGGNHTFRLFNKDFCIGCFITYPTAFIVYILGYLSGLYSVLSTPTLWYFGFGGCSIYLLTIFGLAKKKTIKIFTKIIIGIGIAFCVAAIWSLIYDFGTKLILTLIYFMVGHLFINSMRAWNLYKTCRACKYDFDWGICPGMSSIVPENQKE
ncbi:hypothetical protein DSAG12_00464 [Promethearchaeum syntrophicum]|uniref:Uncharacterized protein n=1 Tax=Promethearchaeum syntrophicum TaxID=2594042 RepID=A0A5B9D6R6_9ARCH|nr:hypothetical protein [Candidatus Prometheoarchaeum syntrophicum]QEE14651.1 hypothetical protein DSAG12_00464 [Candidatus Prometheoarchaeum syntrophicum]